MSKSSRSRNFCMVCYDEQIKDIRQYLVDYVQRGIIRAYYLIKHNPESEDKSLHFHILIEYYDAKTLSSINKKLQLRDGILQYCNDVRSYACYMIHKYELDKERYSPSLIDTNDMERYRQLINADNDNQISSDKLFLFEAYNLIDNRYDFCLADIYKTLLKNKNFTARQLSKYTHHLKSYFESRRYYQETERGLGKWVYYKNNEEGGDFE